MKKSKKFVLAGLVLLVAITMVLLPLAGCKNDTVPPEVEKQEQGDGGGSETDKNNTAANLVSIAVTPPARTVYSVGQSFDPTGMVVTATYDDGEERSVTGTITTDTGTLTQSAGIGKTITVSYKEGDATKEATFTIDVASYNFTETVGDYEYPEGESGTMIGGTYRIFGDWPQTIKEEGVTVGKNTMTRGGMDFHVGNDGNYYVKAEENAREAGYKYSDDSEVKQKDESGSPSTRWFKVEPIVWRVLTTSYKAPEGGTAGNAWLLAEKILIGGIKWAEISNNYMQSYIRQWLNGDFLQTAFTQSALGKIAPTTVDNSAASTTDKIFLLSEEEATNSEYGFGAYDDLDIARIRVTTDYAKATGAYQGDPSAGYGGVWWLRSSFSINDVDYAAGINDDGCAALALAVKGTNVGVVPALSISLQ